MFPLICIELYGRRLDVAHDCWVIIFSFLKGLIICQDCLLIGKSEEEYHENDTRLVLFHDLPMSFEMKFLKIPEGVNFKINRIEELLPYTGHVHNDNADTTINFCHNELYKEFSYRDGNKLVFCFPVVVFPNRVDKYFSFCSSGMSSREINIINSTITNGTSGQFRFYSPQHWDSLMSNAILKDGCQKGFGIKVQTDLLVNEKRTFQYVCSKNCLCIADTNKDSMCLDRLFAGEYFFEEF